MYWSYAYYKNFSPEYVAYVNIFLYAIACCLDQTEGTNMKVCKSMVSSRIIQVGKVTPQYYDDYESFYNAYYSKVLGYIVNKITSFADAEDITGNVFLYCYEKWNEYDPQKASQASWVFMIARSRLVDYFRLKKPCVNIDDMEETLSVDDDPMENAVRLQTIRQELANALKTLPDNQRTAIIMRYFGDYSDTEIAEHLDTTGGNVRVIIHRGINRLKQVKAIAELMK